MSPRAGMTSLEIFDVDSRTVLTESLMEAASSNNFSMSSLPKIASPSLVSENHEENLLTKLREASIALSITSLVNELAFPIIDPKILLLESVVDTAAFITALR